METKANYVLVGIFALVSIVAAFAFVYWTAAIGDRGVTATLRVRIPGSAAGLARGSVVLFNGVKVGDVRRVYLDVNDPSIAIADTAIDRLTRSQNRPRPISASPASPARPTSSSKAPTSMSRSCSTRPRRPVASPK